MLVRYQQLPIKENDITFILYFRPLESREEQTFDMGQKRKQESSTKEDFIKNSEHHIQIGSYLEEKRSENVEKSSNFQTEKSSTNQERRFESSEKSSTSQIRETREAFARKSRSSYERKSYAERNLVSKEIRFSSAKQLQQLEEFKENRFSSAKQLQQLEESKENVQQDKGKCCQIAGKFCTRTFGLLILFHNWF